MLALGERLARLRIDDLGQEVILVDVRAVALFDTLAGDAGSDHLGEPEDVGAAHAQAGVDLVAHRLGPGLRA